MTDSEQSIDKIIAEFMLAAEQGDSPSPEEFIERYPEYEKDLREFFAVHRQFSSSSQASGIVGSVSASNTNVPYLKQAESSISNNPPRFLGDYEILEEIDRGGMGVVYRAQDQKLNRIVALKLIRSGELASQEEVQRFMSEAEAAATLTHPGIVPIYEVGTWNGLVYYTMAYIEGKSLAALAGESPLEPTEAVKIVRRLCAAIQYAHRSGVLHRDLKPANVLINSEGQPVIIDFGLAKVLDSDQHLTRTGQIVGTPAYMTPEHASGKSQVFGPDADVYALGAILYFLCAGQPAFSGPTPVDVLLQVMSRRPAKPSKLNRGVPADIDLVCIRALEKEPEERYQTAPELAADLERILTGNPIDSPKETLTQRLTKWWQREPILAAHTLGIGLTTAIVIIAYLFRDEYTELFYYRIGLLFVWLSASFFLQFWVDLEKWRHVAIYLWLFLDALIYTVLFAFADEPRSMLLIGYPMMVVASALYYQKRFLFAKTGMCIAGFLLLGWLFPKDDFVKSDFAAIFVCGLITISLCMNAMINRVRGLSRFYE
ncbi:MAG: serine/threonine-protein kinase [Planctomycetota bacterium]